MVVATTSEKVSMRSSNKSRSRNKNNNRRSNNVGNVVNRVFDSAGPEGKVRGTPQQIIEKYQGLYRDAQLSGDRVAAENFQQHAEHYTRMLSEAQRELNERREQNQNQNQGQNQQNGSNHQPNQSSGQSQGSGGQPQPAAPAQAGASSEMMPQMPVVDAGERQPEMADNGLATFGEEQVDLVTTPESEASKPKRAPRKRSPRKPAEAAKAADEPKKEEAGEAS